MVKKVKLWFINRKAVHARFGQALAKLLRSSGCGFTPCVPRYLLYDRRDGTTSDLRTAYREAVRERRKETETLRGAHTTLHTPRQPPQANVVGPHACFAGFHNYIKEYPPWHFEMPTRVARARRDLVHIGRPRYARRATRAPLYVACTSKTARHICTCTCPHTHYEGQGCFGCDVYMDVHKLEINTLRADPTHRTGSPTPLSLVPLGRVCE